MARKPNRYLNEISEPMNRHYKTATYRRLSIESKRKESDSLENQRLIISTYLADNKELAHCVQEYEDDGKSGTNFDRPGFVRLINDIKDGKINCVIVKDLSRFARNYVEAGDYIEKIFPYLGIRFISLSEKYDSENPNSSTEHLLMNLKNMLNELYAKDVSKKVHSSYKIKQEAGIFYRSATVPYGYKMGKDIYIPDEEAAKYVKMIFNEYKNGSSKYEISRKLAELNVVPPKVYREFGIVEKDNKVADYWHLSTIHRILINEVYIGNVIRHTQEQRLFEDMMPQSVPEEERVRVEKVHMPIVSKETFYEVQKRLAAVKEKYPASGKCTNIKTIRADASNMFAGKVYCGQCGSRMVRTSNYLSQDGKKVRYMVFKCSKAREYHNCNNKVIIKETSLFALVTKVVSNQIRLVNQNSNLVDKSVENVFKNSLRVADERLSKVQRQLNLLKESQMLKYADFSEGTLKKADFIHYKEDCITKKESLEKEREEITILLKSIEELQGVTIKTLNKWIKGDKVKVNKEVIGCFIEKIIIYDRNKIEISLKHAETWKMLDKATREEGCLLCMK